VDIPRQTKKSKSKYIYAGAAIAGLVGVTVALGNLDPAPQSVERGTLWFDTVSRGTMLRQVRAPGTLVPKEIRFIPAVSGGRIDQIFVRPGTPVQANTVLFELSNPEVTLQALSAQQQASAAEAALVTLRTSLQTQRLNQAGVVAQMRTQYQEARRNVEVYEALDKKGLATANELGNARDLAKELEERLKLEEDRLRIMTESIDDQVTLQRGQIARLRAIADFQQGRVNSLRVTSGAPGVLQDMNLEVGQWVNPGTVMARVAQPGQLKAVLRVPETQGKDITIGQPAAIDTRNGIVKGSVVRIDPSVQNGTIAVDVALDGALPKGARPDLSVDGTIEIERLEDVLYVGRPAYGQAESTVGLFKVEPGTGEAARVNVKLGRSSVNTIEVVQGLAVGDSVIISDMSAYDSADKLRLKK
jgi:HlyD family secretion protein